LKKKYWDKVKMSEEEAGENEVENMKKTVEFEDGRKRRRRSYIKKRKSKSKSRRKPRKSIRRDRKK
jgi:hypothetical protein